MLSHILYKNCIFKKLELYFNVLVLISFQTHAGGQIYCMHHAAYFHDTAHFFIFCQIVLTFQHTLHQNRLRILRKVLLYMNRHPCYVGP